MPVVSQQENLIDETDDEDESSASDLDGSVLNAKFVDELDVIKVDKTLNRLQKARPESTRS